MAKAGSDGVWEAVGDVDCVVLLVLPLHEVTTGASSVSNRSMERRARRGEIVWVLI